MCIYPVSRRTELMITSKTVYFDDFMWNIDQWWSQVTHLKVDKQAHENRTMFRVCLHFNANEQSLLFLLNILVEFQPIVVKSRQLIFEIVCVRFLGEQQDFFSGFQRLSAITLVDSRRSFQGLAIHKQRFSVTKWSFFFSVLKQQLAEVVMILE